jgi:hypothetical protein
VDGPDEPERLGYLDRVTISVTWPGGTTAQVTTTPEEAWDILNRHKPFVASEYNPGENE